MKIFLIFFLLLCLSGRILPQNAYKDYIPNDTSAGQRLMISSFDLIGFEHSRYSSTLSTSVNGNYTKWKFTPKILWAVNASLDNSYSYYKEYSISETHFQNQLRVKGGVSYYLNPNKLYITIGGYGYTAYINSTRTEDADDSFSRQSGDGYVNGAIGYGRIFNAVGIEYGLYFSESLVTHKIAKKKLSEKSLRQIASLIYKFRNGDLAYKYRDDAAVGLFKEAEKIMLQNNDITSPLDLESGIRLYEILSNATNNYFIYPRYQGFQIQAQLQYHLFSDIKPYNHHANVSGIYGIPFSEKDNLLLSGYFSFPIDTLAVRRWSYSAYDPINNPNSNFWALYPDYNNLSFFEAYSGTNFFDGNAVVGNSLQYGLNGSFTHSFNSYAGVTIGATYFENIPKYYSKMGYFAFGAKMDYNIYSSLRLQALLAYDKSITDQSNHLSFHLGGSYIIF